MEQEEKFKVKQEDEIDLMDYVKVILKRKLFILVLFLAAVFAAGVFSFLSAKIYKIDTVLEIGQVGGAEIEAPAQVVEKIGGDVYGILVRGKLKLSEEEYPMIKVENPQGTRLVVMTTESVNSQRAKDILNETISLILEEHQEKFIEKTSLLEEEIAKTEQKLEFLKFYKTYADWGIAQLQTQLSSKKRELSDSKMTEMIKLPTVPEKPIKPRPLLNMAIAGILGLFVGTFLAFGREWWQKSKV